MTASDSGLPSGKGQFHPPTNLAEHQLGSSSSPTEQQSSSRNTPVDEETEGEYIAYYTVRITGYGRSKDARATGEKLRRVVSSQFTPESSVVIEGFGFI